MSIIEYMIRSRQKAREVIIVVMENIISINRYKGNRIIKYIH